MATLPTVKIAVQNDPIFQALVDERDDLKRQVEDLRCEALAWRKQAETHESNVTITLSLDTLRRAWEMVRSNSGNGCVTPED